MNDFILKFLCVLAKVVVTVLPPSVMAYQKRVGVVGGHGDHHGDGGDDHDGFGSDCDDLLLSRGSTTSSSR